MLQSLTLFEWASPCLPQLFRWSKLSIHGWVTWLFLPLMMSLQLEQGTRLQDLRPMKKAQSRFVQLTKNLSLSFFWAQFDDYNSTFESCLRNVRKNSVGDRRLKVSPIKSLLLPQTCTQLIKGNRNFIRKLFSTECKESPLSLSKSATIFGHRFRSEAKMR